MRSHADTIRRADMIRNAFALIEPGGNHARARVAEALVALAELEAALAENEQLRAENARLRERLNRPGEYDLFDPEQVQEGGE